MSESIILPYLLAPLKADLAHEQVTDIVVNEPCRVGVQKAGKWEFRDEPSFTFDRLDAASIAIGRLLRREIDEAHPYLYGTIPGGYRCMAVRDPGTTVGSYLWAIRRPPAKARRFEDPDFDDLFTYTNSAVTTRQQSLRDLVELFRAASAGSKHLWRQFFINARAAGMSMAAVGATGGGKTDFMRRAIQVQRLNTRYVTIETDDELGTAVSGNCGRLFFDESQVSADEAVRIALRLAPKEIWYQEVRGAEAYPLLRAFQTGHDGGGTSWHGDEGREIEALAMMALKDDAGKAMGKPALMEMIREAIDIIVYCQKGDKFEVSSVRFIAAERQGAEGMTSNVSTSNPVED